MPSTTAMFTGLSALQSNARRLDVIGNNIANVNTLGYKSSRMMFASAFSRNLSLGTAPSQNSGGTNPSQVGLGTKIQGIQRDLTGGSISTTGVATDVAIEGGGYFVVDQGGDQVYTRVGAFQHNEADNLVTIDGGRLLGYGIDAQFQVVQGVLAPIDVPIGTLTVAEATRNAVLDGNLNASGITATTGSTHDTRAFYTDMGVTLALATHDLTIPGNDLYIEDGAGGYALAFEGGAGTILTVDGVEKGGQDLGMHSFVFSGTPVAGTDANGATLQDFMDFLSDVTGLDNSTVGGEMLGGGISFAAGVMTVTGNEGTAQELRLEAANIIATNTGAAINQPFVFSQTGSADGESSRTNFVVYDSLGTPITIDITFVLQSTTPGMGSTWTYIAESSDNDDLDRIVGLGTIDFDANGSYVLASNAAVSVTRGNGAVDPLTVTLDFDAPEGAVRALTTTASQLASTFQDGSSVGSLSSFSIGGDGMISGNFTNGLTRNIGQVALAHFSNPEGLVDAGNNNFLAGANSGNPVLTTPLGFGTGRLIGGALELSNVDLSKEFINMILASTGYSAASRIITTTDELIDQLLLLGR